MEEIVKAFLPNSEFTYNKFGSGHIHDTYQICTTQSSQNKYLLQRINDQVFKDIPGMMHNIDLVTKHLKRKIAAQKLETFTTTEIFPTSTGALYFKDKNYHYWRMYAFISNTVSYDRVTSNKQAEEAGKAFGLFQALLSDMDAAQLNITIPDFHNMAYRLDKLKNAVDKDAVGRVKEVAEELELIEFSKKEMLWINKQVLSRKLAERITHNDTKFNNVLLDKNTQAAKAVIDLDTVMPGSILFDFGDAVRTICNTAEEDEPNLDQIDFSLSLFESFTEHYLKHIKKIVTRAEKDLLAMAPHYMTMIMGVRFLTDYLEGDVYYKTQHPAHNLQRAKAQLCLFTILEMRSREMREVVKKVIKR